MEISSSETIGESFRCYSDDSSASPDSFFIDMIISPPLQACREVIWWELLLVGRDSYRGT
jgi:hypothetical protein